MAHPTVEGKSLNMQVVWLCYSLRIRGVRCQPVQTAGSVEVFQSEGRRPSVNPQLLFRSVTVVLLGIDALESWCWGARFASNPVNLPLSKYVCSLFHYRNLGFNRSDMSLGITLLQQLWMMIYHPVLNSHGTGPFWNIQFRQHWPEMCGNFPTKLA